MEPVKKRRHKTMRHQNDAQAPPFSSSTLSKSNDNNFNRHSREFNSSSSSSSISCFSSSSSEQSQRNQFISILSTSDDQTTTTTTSTTTTATTTSRSTTPITSILHSQQPVDDVEEILITNSSPCGNMLLQDQDRVSGCPTPDDQPDEDSQFLAQEKESCYKKKSPEKSVAHSKEITTSLGEDYDENKKRKKLKIIKSLDDSDIKSNHSSDSLANSHQHIHKPANFNQKSDEQEGFTTEETTNMTTTTIELPQFHTTPGPIVDSVVVDNSTTTTTTAPLTPSPPPNQQVRHSRRMLDTKQLTEAQLDRLRVLIEIIREGNYKELLELLERKGSKQLLNVFVDGQTALHYTLIYGRSLAWCKQLVINGANPNLTNRAGWHPIHLAAFNGSRETMLYLIDCIVSSD